MHPFYVRGTDSSGGQLIYDDQQDITWYDFDSGSMAFSNAQTWVNELSITFNNQVLSDWRLPHLSYGNTPLWNYYNRDPLQAEMGELFYNSLNLTPLTVDNLNDGAFDHLQISAYWTDVVYNVSYHYTFSFYDYSVPGWGGGSTGRVGTMDDRNSGFKGDSGNGWRCCSRASDTDHAGVGWFGILAEAQIAFVLNDFYKTYTWR